MKTLVIAANAVRRLLRDRSNIFFVFIFPMLLILLIGASFGGAFEPRLGVVGGGDEMADDLVRRIEATEAAAIVTMDDRDALVDAVARGSLDAGLVIPGDYGATLLAGADATLEFYSRQEQIAGRQLRQTVEAAAAAQSRTVRAARLIVDEGLGDLAFGLELADEVAASVPGVDVVVETVGEALFENLGRFDLGAAQELTLFVFLTSLAGSAALIQSRQLGVSRRMLATPTRAGTVIGGEALGRFLVALVQGVFIMVGALVAFGVNWGDPVGAVAVMVAFSLVGAGGGMLLGSVLSNDQQAGSLGVFAGLAFAALGGAMIPIEIFPEGMRTVAKLTPHAWALDAFAELVRRDGTLVDILPELAVLTAIGAGLLVIASWRFRKTLTS